MTPVNIHPFVLAWTSRSLRKVPQPPDTVSSTTLTHSCVCVLCVYMFMCIGTRMWASITLHLIALFYNFISLFLCLWVLMSLCTCGRQRTTLRSQFTPFRHVCPEDWSQVTDLATISSPAEPSCHPNHLIFSMTACLYRMGYHPGPHTIILNWNLFPT